MALTRAHDSKNYIRATHVINEISRFLDSFKQNGWSINLLAAQTSRDMDDRLPSIIAFHSLKTRSGCNWQSDHMHWKEQLNEILDSDLVISMRYHTTLLSYISGTPFIDITHHDKNKFFLIENQLEKHSCDYWGVSLEMLQACCEQANHMTRFSDTVEEAQQRWHEFDLFWANEIAKKQEEH